MVRRPILRTITAVLIAMAATSASAQRTIHVDTIDNITFGTLENAPNGHIAFQKRPGGYRIWVPGRLTTGTNSHDEGGFIFDLKGWNPSDFASGVPTFVFGHVVDETNPDCTSSAFDRNYAAMNDVIPSADSTTLLAFYDAEYHAVCGAPEPLLASIGLATSNDGGTTWTKQGQVVQGLDPARLGVTAVTTRQQNEFQNLNRILDVGASGPSAVIRQDSGALYIYLYYADRTPITGGDDSIYVARSLLASGGAPGTWQQWAGTTWGAMGNQTSAAPIVVPPAGGAFLQPHVSWNTALRRWLMVFKTGSDFEVTQSSDGLHWDPPTSLLPFNSNDVKSGFPTLITSSSGECQELRCRDDSGFNAWLDLTAGLKPSQQVTGSTGWLFYSSLPQGKTKYVGHRTAFHITAD